LRSLLPFTSPIVLPAGHYFFRPEVQVNGGDFLFLSAPNPIVAPGQAAIAGDLQAWIRNSKLSPDWPAHRGGHHWRQCRTCVQHDLFLERGEVGVCRHARSRKTATTSPFPAWLNSSAALTQLPPHWDSPVFQALQNSFRAFCAQVEEHIHAALYQRRW